MGRWPMTEGGLASWSLVIGHCELVIASCELLLHTRSPAAMMRVGTGRTCSPLETRRGCRTRHFFPTEVAPWTPEERNHYPASIRSIKDECPSVPPGGTS